MGFCAPLALYNIAMNQILRPLAAALLTAALAGCALFHPAPPNTAVVNLVAMNDFHGNLEASRFSYTSGGTQEHSMQAGGIDAIGAALAAVARCGACDTPLDPGGPSDLFCNAKCQRLYLTTRATPLPPRRDDVSGVPGTDDTASGMRWRPEVDADDYRGQPKDTARAALEDLGLKVKEQRVENDGSLTPDTVHDVAPVGTLEEGTEVTLTVAGPAPKPAPEHDPPGHSKGKGPKKDKD